MEATVEEGPVAKVVGYGGRELVGAFEDDGATNVEEVSTSALFEVVGTTAAVVVAEASGVEVAGSGVTVIMTVSEIWVVSVVVCKRVLDVARSELTAGAEVTTAASELVAETYDATAEDDLVLQGFLDEVWDGFPVGRGKPDDGPVPVGRGKPDDGPVPDG